MKFEKPNSETKDADDGTAETLTWDEITIEQGIYKPTSDPRVRLIVLPGFKPIGVKKESTILWVDMTGARIETAYQPFWIDEMFTKQHDESLFLDIK